MLLVLITQYQCFHEGHHGLCDAFYLQNHHPLASRVICSKCLLTALRWNPHILKTETDILSFSTSWYEGLLDRLVLVTAILQTLKRVLFP